MLPTPASYKDIVFPGPDVATLVDNLVTSQLPFPAGGAGGKTGLLIYGPYGTGKTTLAKLLPDAMVLTRGGSPPAYKHFYPVTTGTNGPAFITHLSNLVSSVTAPGASGTYHYVILDEVDNLGAAAMKSLKTVMDLATAIFIMTTNHPGKVDGGVVNRSHLIDMTAPPPTVWLPIAKQALSNAGVNNLPPDAALTKIINLCHGSVRDIDAELEKLRLQLLQQTQSAQLQQMPGPNVPVQLAPNSSVQPTKQPTP